MINDKRSGHDNDYKDLAHVGNAENDSAGDEEW